MHGYSVIWYKVSQSTEVTDYEDGSLMGELFFLTMEMNYSQNVNCIYTDVSVRSWIYSCDFKTIYTKWLCFTLSRYISLLLRKCIKIFIFWKKNLWFNQRVNFKDATPEFERKSMKIWAINNYGRKEHANTPFNTPATLMHEQELPLITWGMIQLGYLMANVKDTWRYPAVQRGDK